MSDFELPTLDSVTLQGYELKVDFFLKKDYDDIGEASEELPAIVEWINTMVQFYLEEKLVSKQEIKEVEASAYFRLLEAPDGRKKTDTFLTRMLCLEDDVKKAHRRYARLVGWVSRLQNLQISFQSKLDLVRSTESTRRQVFDDDTIPDQS
jgi:hypothetical protein